MIATPPKHFDIRDPFQFKELYKMIPNNMRNRVDFYRLVRKNGPIHPVCGQCWTWIGHTLNKRYGRFKQQLAHRISWFFTHRVLDPNLDVLHKCDNVRCVNPDHLFLGTQQDNLADMRAKGKQVRGEKQASSKITEEQAAEIKRRYKRYSHSEGSGALAKEFGLGPVEVWRIATDKRWRRVS